MTPPNDDNLNNEDNQNDPNNPFGFNFDPEAMSSMINNLISGSQPGFAAGMSGAAQEGPMGIAQRVAADIASRDIEEDKELESEVEPDPAQAPDPMVEIMNIMSMLSAPAKKTNALKVDEAFSNRCAQIYPAAQSYVTQEADADDVAGLPLVVTDRVTWTKDYIDSMQGPLQVASESLSPSFGGDESGTPEPDPSQPFGFDLQSIIANTVAPMMFGVQAGTMLGYLSHRAYGDDDVLLPTKLPARVGVIASAVQKFAADWSIPADEAILYFLILQTLRAHIRNNSWLTARLDDLCTRYVAAYELNPYKLEELMSDMDISNPESMTAINVTPEQMFATLRTPTHDVLDEEIGRISSLHDAYVEWVMHKGLEPLLPNYRIIQEARKRITVTTSDADRFVEQLFGVAVSKAERQEAQEFIDGVVERGSENLLHKLWTNEEMIPTESEFAAPGLWLARLEMMDEK